MRKLPKIFFLPKLVWRHLKTLQTKYKGEKLFKTINANDLIVRSSLIDEQFPTQSEECAEV
jgi:hypothetical protein